MTYTPSPCLQIAAPDTFIELQKNQPLVQQNTMLLDQIFASCDYDFDHINQVIDPVLSAQQRCQLTTLYVQGVTVNQRIFLATNLNPDQEIMVLPNVSNWLIGSSPNCSIFVGHDDVDRCHAVLGYLSDIGFYIADVGSQTGTRINRHPLVPLERRALVNGDLIELGRLRVEFFVDYVGQARIANEEETRH